MSEKKKMFSIIAIATLVVLAAFFCIALVNRCNKDRYYDKDEQHFHVGEIINVDEDKICLGQATSEALLLTLFAIPGSIVLAIVIYQIYWSVKNKRVVRICIYSILALIIGAILTGLGLMF